MKTILSIFIQLSVFCLTVVHAQSNSVLEDITISTDLDASIIDTEDSISEDVSNNIINDETLGNTTPTIETEVVEIEVETQAVPEQMVPQTGLEETEASVTVEEQRLKTYESDITVQVEGAIQGWAFAWASQDVGNYLEFYSPSFQPEDLNMSKPEWEKLRESRLLKPRSIELSVSEIELTIKDGRETHAVFEQVYKSDTFSDRILKSMEFILQEGEWKINRERTLKTL